MTALPIPCLLSLLQLSVWTYLTSLYMDWSYGLFGALEYGGMWFLGLGLERPCIFPFLPLELSRIRKLPYEEAYDRLFGSDKNGKRGQMERETRCPSWQRLQTHEGSILGPLATAYTLWNILTRTMKWLLFQTTTFWQSLLLSLRQVKPSSYFGGIPP